MNPQISIIDFLSGQLLSLFIIYCLDFGLCKLINQQARWFQLHAVVNTLITFLVYNDVIAVFLDPMKSLDLSVTKDAGQVCLALHAYHILTFNNLTKLDYAHHILSVFLAGVPGIFFWSNPLIHVWYIFACGIPGGIEYYMLCFVKHGYMSKLTQKRWSSLINTYIRCPGILFVSFASYIGYMSGLIDLPGWFVFYLCFSVFMNGTFFGKLSVENHIHTIYKSEKK